MNNKKLICLFIMTLCVFSCEALTKESVLNKHDLFLKHSDIPKTLTVPNQEALDKFNKSLQQEAAKGYKAYKDKEAFDKFDKDYQRFRKEAEKNYNDYKRKNNIKSHYENRNDFSITIPISK